MPLKSPNAQDERFRSMVLTNLDSGFNLALSLLSDRTDAEDALQEASVKAYRAFSQFHGDNGKAWFLKIVRNECMNTLQRRYRARGRELRLDETFDDTLVAPQDMVQASIVQVEREELMRAIDGLPVALREVIVLRELEELSYRHIASIVDIPMGTVMSRLARARCTLLNTLAPKKDLS